MHIQEIRLKSFGDRSGLLVGGLEEGVNLIYGCNEAGKTTLMEAVRSAFFGFLDLRSKRNLYKSSDGSESRHVRLRIRVGDAIWNLDRTEGKNGLKIIDENGRQISERELLEPLHHADRELYENIFAFSLKEMSDIASLDAAAIQDRFLGTALGAGAVSPGAALQTIEKKLELFYKPRGSTSAIVAAGTRIDEIASRIRTMQEIPEAYDKLIEEIDVQKKNSKEQKRANAENNRTVISLQRLIECRKEWETLKAAKTEAEQLRHAAMMPPDAAAKLEGIEREIDRLQQMLDQQRRKIQDTAAQRSAIVLTPASHAIFSDLDTFLSEGTQQDHFPKDIQDREDALEKAKREVEKNRLVCGVGWTPEAVGQVAPDKALRQEMSSLVKSLKDAMGKLENTTARLRESREMCAELRTKFQSEEKRIKELSSFETVPPDAASVVARQETQLEEIRNELERLRENAERLEKMIEPLAPDEGLAHLAPALEKAKHEFQIIEDCCEKATVSRSDLRTHEVKLKKFLAGLGKGIEEAIIRDLVDDEKLPGDQTQWSESWSDARSSCKAVETHLDELNTRCNQAERKRDEDFGELRAIFGEDATELEVLQKIIPEQKSRLREFEQVQNVIRRKTEQIEESINELRSREALIDSLVKKLGAWWNREKIMRVPVTSEMHLHIQTMSTKLLSAAKSLEEEKARHAGTLRKLDEVRAEYGKSMSSSADENDTAPADGPPPVSLATTLRKWQSLKQRIEMLEGCLKSEEQRLQEQEEQAQSLERLEFMLKKVSAGAIVLTLVVAILFFLGKSIFPAITFIIVGLFISGALWFLSERMNRTKRDQRKKAEKDRSELERKKAENAEALAKLNDDLRRLTGELPKEIVLTKEAVTAKLSEIEAEMNLFFANRDTLRRIDQVRNQIETLEETLRNESESIAEKTRLVSESERLWQQFLTDHSLPEGKRPEEILFLLEEIRTIRSELLWVENRQNEINEKRNQIQSEKNSLGNLVSRDHLPSGDFNTVLTSWEKRIRTLEECFAAGRHLASIQEEIGETKTNLDERRMAMEKLRNGWEVWCNERKFPGSADPSDSAEIMNRIRDAYEIILKIDTLKEEISRLENKITTFKDRISTQFGIETDALESVARLAEAIERKYRQCMSAVENLQKRKELEKELAESSRLMEQASQRRAQKEESLHKTVVSYGFRSAKEFHDSAGNFAEFRKLKELLPDSLAAMERAEKRSLALEKDVQRESDRADQAVEALKNNLALRHLPKETPPESVIDLVDALIEYAKSIANLEECESAYKRIRERWNKMTSRYKKVLDIFGYSTDFDALEPATVIGTIRSAVHRLGIERENVKTHEILATEEEKLVNASGQTQTDLDIKKLALEKLISDSLAPDRETFRNWIRDADRLRELAQLIGQKEAVLMTSLNIPDPKEVYRKLETLEWDAEELRLRDLSEMQKTSAIRIQELDEEIGRNDQKRKDIERVEELASARQEEASENAKLRAAFFEWAEWMVAKQLVEMARERFEKERQPKVLIEASNYFETLTCGNWTGIKTRIGEKQMEARRKDGCIVPIINLSSGTAGPLYLSLRLALIEDYAKSPMGAPPVLMDDILVNFDDSRVENAADALMKLGEKTQLILLSCHSRTLETFRKQKRPVNIVEIAQNTYS